MKVSKCFLGVIAVILFLVSLFINPLWPIEYYACLKVKKMARKDLPELIAWVDYVRDHYPKSITVGIRNVEADWRKFTEDSTQYFGDGKVDVNFIDFTTGFAAKSWTDVDLIELKLGWNHRAYVKYRSAIDITEFSKNHRFESLSDVSAVYCGSRFNDGD